MTLFYKYSGAIALIMNVGMAAFVYAREKRSVVSIKFALLSSCIGFWAVGSWLVNSVSDKQIALWILRGNYAFGVFVPVLFLDFIENLSASTKSPYRRLGYALSLAFLATLFTPYFINGLRLIPRYDFYISSPGAIYYLFVIFFCVFFVLAFRTLFLALKNSGADEKRQLWYVFLAYFVGMLAGIEYFCSVFGLLKRPPIDDYILIVTFLILTYAIAKHGLLDIRLVIKRTALYALLAFLLSLVYVSIIFATNKILEGGFSEAEPSLGRLIFSMNPFALSGLLIGLSSMTMAILVFIKNRSSIVNRLWSFFCILVAFWGFGSLAIGLAQDPQRALIYWRVAYIGVILIPALFYHFVVIFIGLRRPVSLAAVYVATFIFLIVNATPLMLPTVSKVFGQFYYARPIGTIFPYFYIFFNLVVVMSHVDLWKSMRTTQNKLKRTQIKWFFIATAIGFTGGSTCFLPMFWIDIYPYGNFTVPLYPVIMAYAIIKHQLMDIQVVIRKTIYYSSLTVAISLIYLVVVFLFYSAFFSRNGTPSVLMSFMGILFIAVTFKPLEIWLHRTLERKFFKGTIGEISEQKDKLETELERRERLKSVGILAAGMAHEIKNPITAIKTFAEYLPQKYNDPEYREKFNRIVSQETERISEIVRNLLLFSKPLEPNARKTNIAKILSDILDLLSNEMLNRNVQVSKSFNSSEAYVDPDQIKQALLNIIMNAIEAMKDRGGELSIKTETQGKWLHISVRDTGYGIPAEKIHSIFDPFYTDKEEGTGLGLAITYSIIEKNQGKIRVESEEGKGTTFTIDLPISQ